MSAGHQIGLVTNWPALKCGGGNNIADELLKLPGLVGCIHSKPAEPATIGGDVYYVSVCDKPVISRVVLADVAGHGEAVGEISPGLRMLVTRTESRNVQTRGTRSWATEVYATWCAVYQWNLLSRQHPRW